VAKPEVALTQSNPTVARIRLAALFREARERAGKSLDDLARFLSVSAPQASRLDSGARGFRPRDVPRLAEWYGFDEAEAPRLLALAEESMRREWWQQIDLDDAYRGYIGMEQVAQTISEYHINVIPGLLQTRDYALVAASVAYPGASPEVRTDVIERSVEVRLRRQEILERQNPPTLTVVIDEAVLARCPLDPKIRRGQLEHLRAAANRPNVVVQIIAFDYGLYTGPNSNFILLGLGDGLSDVFYAEGLRGGYASSDASVLGRNGRIWTDLRAKALDDIRSKGCIDRYIRELP
jgi:transcriptional regulator with XRE-family HTH domain